MAYFVGDDFGDLLLYPNAAILVYKEHDLPKRDGSPVLHRSSGKLRDRDEMQLGKVVLRTKIGLEEFDRISGDAQRIHSVARRILSLLSTMNEKLVERLSMR